MTCAWRRSRSLDSSSTLILSSENRASKACVAATETEGAATLVTSIGVPPKVAAGGVAGATCAVHATPSHHLSCVALLGSGYQPAAVIAGDSNLRCDPLFRERHWL